MFTIRGKYNEAIVYADQVEDEAIAQIYNLLSCEAFKGSKIRIMKDVHAGAGCVIGFTCSINNLVVPNLVGVDIGCGVSVALIGSKKINYSALDDFIRNEIPYGFGIRSEPLKTLDSDFTNNLNKICKKINISYEYSLRSISTLGGGNHFIEIVTDPSGFKYLTIHTGSRNFGLKVCNFHQNVAKDYCNKNSIKVPRGLEYLEGDDKSSYLSDMKFAQMYARINRKNIAQKIMNYLEIKAGLSGMFESVHNYISDDNIIRKGAVSAEEGELVYIPLNMRDGGIFGYGKGNPDYNCSAPHGAGRIMSRGDAKRTFTLEEFQKEMSGIFSTSVNKNTIDESPMAYKSFGTKEEIIESLKDTMEVEIFMKPEYNFKAS